MPHAETNAIRERAPRLDNKTRREQIAQAALDLVSTRGYRALTVKRLAGKVGLTPSGLYRHFPDKAAILDAILELIADSLQSNIQRALSTDGNSLDKLAALLRLQVDIINARGFGTPRLFFSDDLSMRHPEKQARLREIMEEFTGSVAAIMAQGQAEGLIRNDIAPSSLGVMYMGLFQPGALMHYLHRGEYDMKSQAEAAWRLYVVGLTTKGVEAPPLYA
ncbi:MAG: TetR/AcrR family transcriptional regulator [Oceanidesulfovibrio sp.]